MTQMTHGSRSNHQLLKCLQDQEQTWKKKKWMVVIILTAFYTVRAVEMSKDKDKEIKTALYIIW